MYVRDSRAVLGGLALLLSGGILTSLIQLYFAGAESGAGIVTSRWWWEIVMNVQVASVACMWFCYVDRISSAEGSIRAVLRFRMICNICIVLLPLWVALLSANFNWFVERPPLVIIDYLIVFMLFSWAFAVLLARYVILLKNPEAYGGKGFWAIYKPNNIWRWSPGIIAVLLWGYGQIFGGTLHYRYIPVLLYTQGALPFFFKGLTARS